MAGTLNYCCKTDRERIWQETKRGALIGEYQQLGMKLIYDQLLTIPTRYSQSDRVALVHKVMDAISVYQEQQS